VSTVNLSARQIHSIPANVLSQVRQAGVDVSGTPIEHVTAEGGEPLRCCLRDAEPGTGLILFGYEPPIPKSPYREIGAVFAHAEPCDGPGDDVGYPSEWLGRPQVLRAYDQRGWIHAATVHDGQDPEAAIADMLDDAEVVLIHSRNVAYGCFMFSISRRR
jgi:hypothetical protein